jgi:hypothetical protein
MIRGLTARSASARSQPGTGEGHDEPAGWLPYTCETEMQEAAENFRAYLAILEEWDEKEKERTKQEID